MAKMKVTEKVIKRFLGVVPQIQDFAEDGRWIDDDEFDVQLSLKKVIAFLNSIKKIQAWDWDCQALAVQLEIEELVAQLNRRPLVRFIRQNLRPKSLHFPASRVEVLQPLGGRAPPETFTPIPHKIELGSYARSDLADSAY